MVFIVLISHQAPVSRKSQNFAGAFRASLYLQHEGTSRHKTLQLFQFLFPLEPMKRPALQSKGVGVLEMAFRTRKVFGSPEEDREVSLEPQRCEDIKGIVAQEMGPRSFGTFHKQ